MLTTAFLALSGNVIGYFLGKYTYEELNPGKKLLHWLQIGTLAILASVLLFYFFNLFSFLAGIILGIFLTRAYFYFGLAAASSIPNANFALASTILIFLYGLPTGSLNYLTHEKKTLLKNALLYLVGFALASFYANFISFTAGALISITLRELTHALPHRPWHW